MVWSIFSIEPFDPRATTWDMVAVSIETLLVTMA
jgi:hypothetical protein